MQIIEKTVAELAVADLGRVVATNGYRAELRSVAIAEDPSYVEVVVGDRVDRVRTWVKPEAACRVEVPE